MCNRTQNVVAALVGLLWFRDEVQMFTCRQHKLPRGIVKR